MNQPEKPIRPNIGLPPRRRSNAFLPDMTAKPADNMSGEKLAPMTFNMPKAWHTRFKMTAAAHGVSMKDLLIEAFDAWEQNQREKEKAK